MDARIKLTLAARTAELVRFHGDAEPLYVASTKVAGNAPMYPCPPEVAGAVGIAILLRHLRALEPKAVEFSLRTIFSAVHCSILGVPDGEERRRIARELERVRGTIGAAALSEDALESLRSIAACLKKHRVSIRRAWIKSQRCPAPLLAAIERSPRIALLVRPAEERTPPSSYEKIIETRKTRLRGIEDVLSGASRKRRRRS